LAETRLFLKGSIDFSFGHPICGRCWSNNETLSIK